MKRKKFLIVLVFLSFGVLLILPAISYMPKHINERYAILRELKNLDYINLNGFENITVIPGKPIGNEFDSLLERLYLLNQEGVEHTNIIIFCANNTEITDSTVKIILRFKSLKEISLEGCPKVTDDVFNYIQADNKIKANIGGRSCPTHYSRKMDRE